jgi:hypothetical protein
MAGPRSRGGDGPGHPRLPDFASANTVIPTKLDPEFLSIFHKNPKINTKNHKILNNKRDIGLICGKINFPSQPTISIL